MIHEIRALVAISELGSLHRAAERLHLTPSAVTRQVQRLEASLDAQLLDRRVKPVGLTPTGRAVLERSRSLIASLEELKASARGKCDPEGPFRVGFAHALADPGVVPAIARLAESYPMLRPQFSSDATGRLLDRVRTGDLECASVLVADAGRPVDVSLTIIASQPLCIVETNENGRGRQVAAETLTGRRWILNPAGCMVRDALASRLAEAEMALDVAAEVSDIGMQFSMVAAGLGLGLLPKTFVDSHPKRSAVAVLRCSQLKISVSVAFARARHLGALAPAADSLERDLQATFAAVPIGSRVAPAGGRMEVDPAVPEPGRYLA